MKQTLTFSNRDLETMEYFWNEIKTLVETEVEEQLPNTTTRENVTRITAGDLDDGGEYVPADSDESEDEDD